MNVQNMSGDQLADQDRKIDLKNLVYQLQDCFDRVAKEVGYIDIDHMIKVLQKFKEKATLEEKEQLKKLFQYYWIGK